MGSRSAVDAGKVGPIHDEEKNVAPERWAVVCCVRVCKVLKHAVSPPRATPPPPPATICFPTIPSTSFSVLWRAFVCHR